MHTASECWLPIAFGNFLHHSFNSAVTFWQTETQHKYFEAWRNARTVQLEKADKLRRKLMLQKGLSALRFAVSQHKQSVSEVQTRARARITAKYWLKVWKSYNVLVGDRISSQIQRNYKNQSEERKL